MIICEKCSKGTATVHITEVLDEGQRATHLCAECARDLEGLTAGKPLSMSAPTECQKQVRSDLQESIGVKQRVIAEQLPLIEKIATAMTDALRAGRRVYLMGNGGSAADSQHIAGELIGRFKMERNSLPAVALTTDTSVLTAIANDYGFDRCFARQVEGLVQEGDIVIGITTSGNSPNVLEAVKLANERGAVTIGFTGEGGGKLAELATICFEAPSSDTPRIQEAHITVAHALCDQVEKQLFGEQRG